MAVSEMKMISIIGLMQDIGEVVKICGESGIFQPDNVFSFYSNTERFVPINEENPHTKLIKRLVNIVKESNQSLNFVDISDFDADDSQIVEYVEYVSDKLGDLIKEKKEYQSHLGRCKNEICEIEKFKGLNAKINDLTDCEYVKIRFGKLPKESYDKLSIYSKEENVLFFPCTKDADYYWGVYFAPVEELDEIDRVFSGLYFESVKISSFDGTVEEKIDILKREYKELSDKVFDIEKKIDAFWSQQKGQYLRVYSKLKQMETFYGIKKFAARYNESFILVGWIPAEEERKFCRELSEVNGVEYSTETGKNILSHSPPVRLKNKKLFKPFEFFVNTYGLPSYDEIDPTPFLSITYTILFGIMFADLGQGLVVSLVGYLIWKLKNMKLGGPMMICGISSAIFGTIFGSVFGYEHVLDPFYKNVFGLEEKPIEVMSSGATNLIIYSAIGIGIVLLICAIIINIYSLIRRHKYGEAIFSPNGLAGLITYSAMVLLLVDMMFLNIGIVSAFYVSLFIVLPLVLIMFSELLGKLVDGDKNWKPESWGDYIIQSVFELFEVVLSYLSNTLSFIRVGAFIFVHSGMMIAVLKIADMMPNARLLVAIIGNIIVICLEVLLSGIQVLRLQYYELFSRFYEGEGRPFEPVVLQESDI